MNLEGKARHRKIMRALKEEATDQEVFLKKKYKNIIEDNVKDGLYSMDYILEHKLYLPEPPAIVDAELKASGKIKTIGKESETYDVREMRAHFQKKEEKMAELRRKGDKMLDDDVLFFNSLKEGQKIRLCDDTPLYEPASRPRYARFDVGKRPDEAILGPLAAKIDARAEEIIRRHPPSRGTYRLAPEIDAELNDRKEEKRQLMKKSDEITQRHLYTAEVRALLQKAEDQLLKPTYMPKEVIGIPENPFRVKEEEEKGKKKTIVRDEEIEELLNQAEEKISYRFDPKAVHNKPRTILVMDGSDENATFNWYTERINNSFAAEDKQLTAYQKEVRGIQRNVQDTVLNMRNKKSLLSLANGMTYQKEQKIHPQSFGDVTKRLEAVDARERLKLDVCDVSKRNLKSAFMDQAMWREEKNRRDRERLYEAGIIPGNVKLQEEATAADKFVDDYLRGRIRV